MDLTLNGYYKKRYGFILKMKAHEIVTEIVSIEGRDEPIENKLYLFNNTRKIMTPAFSNGIRYQYSQSNEYGVEYHALLHTLNDQEESIVALMGLESERLGKMEILSTQVIQSLRGMGLMRYLLNKALEVHDEIYSDTHQSPSAIHFWKMLLLYPEPSYRIMIYDIDTQEKKPIERNVDKELVRVIWNEKENPILVCVKNKFSVNETARYQKNNEIRKKVNRDDWQIWYSKSVTPGYENP